MYKNQLQEFAQRSCINLPAYSCIREGPDHAPRFKAKVNFNGEVFESPKFCSTLRQAEHAAAEVALKTLSQRGPSRALATKVLDETGVYKNLLQETAHRAGMKLPAYTTVRTGPGYAPIFTCTVELAGMSFSGEPAKTKKQAQKTAAMVAWFSLKELSQGCSSSHHLSDLGRKDEQEQVIVACFLSSIKLPERKPLQRYKGKFQNEGSLVKGDVVPYDVGRSSYRMPHQNFTYSYFPPEVAMHQSWHRGIPQQQSHLFSLPSASTSIPRPRLFPLLQSIFRPDIGSIFWAREQEKLPFAPGSAPFFCFSNELSPVSGSSDSHVTIEEIEGNNQVQEEWLNKNVNSACWRGKFSLSISGVSPTSSSNHPISSHNSTNIGVESLQKKTGEKTDPSSNVTRKSSQLQTHQDEDFSWLPPGFISNRDRVIEAGETRQRLESLNSSGSLSDLQCLYPSFASSPGNLRGSGPLPTVSCLMDRKPDAYPYARFPPEVSSSSLPASIPRRATVFTCSTRPGLEGMKHLRRMPCASQMAPAVQIRSVMPVCSSPPRQMPSPNQDFTGGEKET